MRHIRAFCKHCGNEVPLPIAEIDLSHLVPSRETMFIGLSEPVIHVCPEEAEVPPPLGGREYEGDTQ